jgi:hypothetical protein
MRGTLYRVTPIFLAILMCGTNSGLMVFADGTVKVVVMRRFLSLVFNRLNAVGCFNVGLTNLIVPCGARVEIGGYLIVVPTARLLSPLCTWCARGKFTT